MSGNGPRIGSRQSTRPTLQRHAAFRKTLAAGERKTATTLANQEQKFPAGSSKGVHICARRTTAAAIALQRVMRKTWTRPQATSDFAASFDRSSATINQP